MKKKLNVFTNVKKNKGCSVVVKAVEPGAKIAKVYIPKTKACMLSDEEQDLITSAYRKEFRTDNDVMIGIWDKAFLTV